MSRVLLKFQILWQQDIILLVDVQLKEIFVLVNAQPNPIPYKKRNQEHPQ